MTSKLSDFFKLNGEIHMLRTRNPYLFVLRTFWVSMQGIWVSYFNATNSNSLLPVTWFHKVKW